MQDEARPPQAARFVGAEVLGFVFGPQHFSCGLNEDPAVLEAAEDEALFGADCIEHAACPGGQRERPCVSRLVDVL